jgi:7,8-dihydro-6-hydroxymethylpterin-pyrophosphokinase
MHQRAFVLRPLQELFGDELRLSDTGLTLAACLAAPAVAAQITRPAL